MARAPASIGVTWSRPRGSDCNRHNRETDNIMKSVDLYRISPIWILACTLNVYGQEGSNNVEQRVNSILSQRTLDEKISYIGGTPSLTSNRFHSLICKRRSTRRSTGHRMRAQLRVYDRRRSLSGKQLIPKVTRAIQEQGVWTFKCFAEKPELQFASPTALTAPGSDISIQKQLKIFEKNGYNTFKSTCPHPCAGPDGSTTVGSLPLDGRSGSRRQLDPGRS